MKKEVIKQVKKRSKKIDFYFTIYSLIKQGNKLPDICSKLNISKQNLKYYTDYLKGNGYIKRIGYGTWEVKKDYVTDEGRPTSNLHALNIKFPILWGKIKEEWQIGEKLNNWIVKYKDLDILGGLKLQNNNNKSITVYVKSRDIKNLNEIDNLAFKVRTYVYDFLKKKGVILDVFNCETKNINIQTEDKEAGKQLRKGEKFELNLNKRAEKIFPKDNIAAKAWMDTSPSKGVETNDKEWKREYLSMPFRIRDMLMILPRVVDNLNYVAENYKSHVEVVVQAKKLFKKINRQLSQKDLRKWL